MDDDTNDDLPRGEGATFHPFYDGSTPKITLQSSDGQKFCVDRLTLSTYR